MYHSVNHTMANDYSLISVAKSGENDEVVFERIVREIWVLKENTRIEKNMIICQHKI